MASSAKGFRTSQAERIEAPNKKRPMDANSWDTGTSGWIHGLTWSRGEAGYVHCAHAECPVPQWLVEAPGRDPG
jgi:hypothetical protein